MNEGQPLSVDVVMCRLDKTLIVKLSHD